MQDGLGGFAERAFRMVCLPSLNAEERNLASQVSPNDVSNHIGYGRGGCSTLAR
jgi:hypothetical protein